MRACFVLTVSSLPYSSDCFNLLISETENKKYGTSTKLSNSITFPFGIAFLTCALNFFKFLKQCTQRYNWHLKQSYPILL